MQLQVLITYSGRIRITGTMLYVANQIRSICSTLANLNLSIRIKNMKKLEGKVAVITEKARDLVLKVIGDG